MFSSGQKGFPTSTPFGGTSGSSVFSQSSGFTFGSQQPQPQPQSTGLFGNPSFAQPTQTSQPSTGLFGAQPSQPAQTGGLFGASNPTSNVFGAKATFGGTGTGFGASSTGTGLFGSTAGSTAAPTTGTGLFGSGAPSGGGLFGSVTAAAPSAGGTTTKFVPPTSTDTAQRSGTTVTVNTKHQCITAMKDYESKSLEELRLEDYAANRKGPQAGTTTAPAAGGGIFGATPAAPGFGTFGNPAASTSSSLFGSTTQPTGTGLFGTTAQRPLFGGTATTTSSSVFGSTGKTLFEAPAMNQNKGLFGANTGTSTGGFLFGQSNPAQPAATASTGLFGAKTAFGTATTSATGFGTGTGTGLFGGATGTGLFGGAKTTGGFGFGTTTTATTAAAPFSFGTGTSTTGGLFGASTAAAPKPAAFGFPSTSQTTGPTIGSGAPFGQGLFGQPAANTTAGAARPLFGGGTGGLGFNFGPTNPGLGMGGPGVLGQPQAANQPAAIGLSANPDEALAQQARIQQQVLDLVVNLPYGHSSLFKNTLSGLNKSGAGGGSSQPDRPLPIPTNPDSQRAATQQMRLNVSGRATAKPRTRPLGVVNNGANPGASPHTSGRRQLFTGLDEEELARADNFFVRRSDWMKLNIPGGSSNNSVCTDVPLPANGKSFPEVEVSASPATDSSRKDEETSFRQSLPMSGDRGGVSHDISCWRGPDDDDPSILVLPDSSSQPEPHPCKVVLNKAGYYCIPSLDEIAEQGLDSDGRCLIENLVVGHKGYGRVLFLGTTDVAGLDFDAAVHIRRKEITVYPDDSSKPKVGDGLNKKAEVTLIGVWPTDKATGEPIKDSIRLEKMHFADKLERATSKMGARFIEYQPESGSWVFEVKHFSKYRYDESDDDEGDEIEVVGAEGEAQPIAESQTKIADDKKMDVAAAQKSAILERNQNNRECKDKSNYGQLQKTVEKIRLFKDSGYPNDEAWLLHKDSDGLSSSEGEAAGLAVDGLIDEMPPWPIPPGQAEDELRKMYPAPRTLGGVSTQSVQLMKASFFGAAVDLDEDGVSVNDDGISGQQSSAYDSHINAKRQRLFTHLSPSPLQESPRQSHHHDSGSPHRGRHSRLLSQSLLALDPHPPRGPSAMVRESESTRLLPASLRLGLPASAKLPQLGSLDNEERERDLWMDEGWNRGNGCRVAWGPDNVVWPPTTMWSEEEKDEDKMEGEGLWTECEGVNRVLLTTTPGRNEIHESLLNLSLDTSEVNVESGCPLWTPIEGRLPLSSYDSALTPGDERISALRRAVDLCSALWGRLDGPDDDEEEDENSYAMRMERKEALSAWLRAEVMPATEAAVGQAESSSDATFAWLTAGCLPEACQVAQKGGEHRLALLVAQARGSDCMRRMLIRQLEEWREVGMDTRISTGHLRTYALLAGHMTWRGSTPDGPTALSRGPHTPLVNVCADLDWTRAFAVHLWYNCAFHQDISHALAAYKASFRGSDRYAAPPLPQGSDCQHWDVAYHLLQLHCKRCHRMEKLLCPETFGRDGGGPHEWQAVWHLWRILDALGYRHLSPVRFAQLQCEFADQLERGGVWEWAVFVLLHLQDAARREAAVRELLARRVGEEIEEEENEMEDIEIGECEARRERFLVERLKVPAEWIYEAKAVRARSRGDPVAETQLWSAAHRWEEAHQVLVGGLCSRLVVTGEVEEIEKLVKPLSSPEAVAAIRQWTIGGQLFLDWVTLRKEADYLKSEDVYSMESVRHRVVSICDRLEHLKARDTLEKMCHSEIAKDCARVLRLLAKDGSFIYEVSRMLTQLPLPEDSGLKESLFLDCQRLTSLQTS